MTREEAIEKLNGAIKLAYSEADAEVCRMAISALREQEERSKGCEHCRSEINRGLMLAHGFACCTDCGRRLEDT